MDGAPAAEPGAGGKDEWYGFSRAWLRGYLEIFAIRLARGRRSPAEEARKSARTLFRWLGLAYLPALLAAVVILSTSGHHASLRVDEVSLLLTLGTINGGMFAAAVLAWGYALHRASTVDDLLRPCAQRDKVVTVVEKAVRFKAQIVLPMLFAAVPWIVVLSSTSTRIAPTPADVLLLLNVTWTMAILGNICYWLLVPPWLVVRLRACGGLALRWNDPARTAGIRTFSEGYAYPALFLAMGALAVTVPGLVGHPLFGRYLPYLYGLLLLLSIWVGVVTQLVIYTIVRRFKLRMLDDLAPDEDFLLPESKLPEVAGRVRTGWKIMDTLSAYNAVAAAPGLPYGTGVVLQYVGAIVGSIASLLLQYLS